MSTTAAHPQPEKLAEFTFKAVVAGIVLGVVFGAANAYLGLRVGMTVSASIPAAVMTVAVFSLMRTRGTLLEAMKYEKRMETAFTGYMIWYTDSRGWGDLPTGTVLEWPVPYQEMQSRRASFYDGTNVAAPGTYGFGVGNDR